MLPALVTAAGGGWVTQMQSKYGVTAKHAADIWAGDVSDTDSQVYKTIGYYWHAPQDVDSNRGLGGGIQWAWDDSLCRETRAGKDFPTSWHATLEDKFREGRMFINCIEIKAALHRAFKVWEDMHQHIQFVDVTEECRRLYGRVQSNCSLLELFVTSRDSYGVAVDVGKPYPFGTGSQGFPLPDPQTGESLADVVTGFPQGRRLGSSSRTTTAAASATQYGRYAKDLRSTNGHVQRRADNKSITAMETYGGVIAFNVDVCWYLDSQFCAPVHSLMIKIGADGRGGDQREELLLQRLLYARMREGVLL